MCRISDVTTCGKGINITVEGHHLNKVLVLSDLSQYILQLNFNVIESQSNLVLPRDNLLKASSFPLYSATSPKDLERHSGLDAV